jgi:minor extracellular serine protease Vpr
MNKCPRSIGRNLIALSALMLLPALASARPIISPALRGLDPEQSPVLQRSAREIPGKGTYVDLFLQGDVDEAALLARGVLIGSRLENGVITAKVPMGRLAELSEVPGLERISAAYKVKTNNNASVPATLATPNYWTAAPPNFTGQAGAGVIVGIVDTGIDYHHDDFKNPDGTSRILYIWDQRDTGGPSPPGFAYGSYWTTADLNSSAARHSDTAGHGTHVAGIAAGDGSATGNGQPANQFIGMAPRSDIICVATTFSTSGVVDAVNFIFQRAAALGKNAVVNLSLGTQYGAHDGTEAFDVAMNSLTGPGKIIVASAGNEGSQSLHSEQLVPPGGPQTVTFTVPTYTPNGGGVNDLVILDCYYNGSDNMQVTLTSPGPTPITVGPINKGANGGNAASLAGNIYVENGFTPSPSGDANVFIQIYDSSSSRPPRAGVWTITLTPVSTTASTQLDLWHSEFQLGSAGLQPVFSSDVDEAELVGSPGCASDIIAVAAYTTKTSWPSIDNNSYQFSGFTPVGQRANFSSPGPNRNNAAKPDLTAPGSAIVSTLSAAITIPNALKNPDGVHWTQQGTSMSAPHVTGAVALILADQPGMTPAQVKSLLASDALVDGFTGAVPNAQWGAGKLRMIRHASSSVEPAPIAARPMLFQNRPNPFNPVTTISYSVPAAGHVSLQIFSVTGRLVRTLVDQVVPAGLGEAVWDGRTDDGTAAGSGVYFYRFKSGTTTETRRLVMSK